MTEPVLNKNSIDENGKRHSYWEKYWSDGQLFSKGNYIHGKLCGYWEVYWDDGELMIKQYYL